MEQPASPPSTSMAPATPAAAPSYAPANRLSPRWVPGAGQPAGAAPGPDCLVQPWMVASRPRRMAVQAPPRRRSAAWPVWLVVLALAGLGGYGLSGMDREQLPELGSHAGGWLAAQDTEQAGASTGVPPAGAAAREAFPQEDSERPDEPAAAAPPPETPAVAQPVPAVPAATATATAALQNAGPRAAPAGLACSDALAAMQLCGVASSR